MAKEKFLDSSVLVALFRQTDALHIKALEIFKSGGNFFVLDYVFSEVVTVLKNKENMETVRAFIDYIFDAESIDIYRLEGDEFLFAVDLFRDAENKLSFVDTLLLALSELKGHDVITFDKELAAVL